MLNEAHLRRWRFWRRSPARLDLTGILWPSLGYPAVVDVQWRQARIVVLLCLPDGAPPSPSQFRARLLAARGTDPLECRTVAAERVALAGIEGIGRWAPWVLDGAPSVVRLQLAAACPGLRRRTTLFDLEVEFEGTSFRKAGSVALHSPGAEFRIALATDLHLAARWDEFETGFSGFHEEAAPADSNLTRFTAAEGFSRQTVLNTFVNPNHALGAFIREVNELAEREQADAVILSGDLVDFKYNRHRAHAGRAFGDTGWKLLYDLVRGGTNQAPQLRVPLFTSTGNHDYRLYPYRFRTYGMRHAGIPDAVSEPYLRSQGEWGRLKYSAGDLDAVRIDSGDTHSLDFYFREFNPCLDYELSLGGARFLLLDSGPDAITNLGHLNTVRWRRFARGLRHIGSPYSDGFGEEQIEYLRRWFARTGQQTAVVVSHAPLIFPPEQPEALLTVPEDGDGSSHEFEAMLTDRGLDRRSIISNQLAVFQALRAHPGPALFFAGHCHTEAEMVLDRETRRLYHSSGAPPGAAWNGTSGHARLLHTPALGHGHPAYRLIRVNRGLVEGAALVHLRGKPLDEWKYDEWIYDWVCAPQGGGLERVEFSIRRRVAGAPQGGVLHRLILRFAGAGVAGVEALTADLGAVAAAHLDLAGTRHPYACWVIHDVPSFRITLRGRPPGARMSFLYETVHDGERSGLRWHPNGY